MAPVPRPIAALLLSFGLRFFVPRADEAAFDSYGAVVIEDHKGSTARDVVRIVGLPFRLQPSDFCFQLAELRVYVVGQFFDGLILFGQLVELALGHLQSVRVFCREFDGMRINRRMPCACGKSSWASVHFQPSASRNRSASLPSFAVTKPSSKATSSR